MLTQDMMLGSLYILMAVMLVLGGLMTRRTKFSQLIVMLLAWVAIFGAGFVIFTFRDDLHYVAQRLRAEATGEPVVEARTLRVPMALDGHFWVDGEVNGHEVRFLVDSGATVTTIGGETAAAAGIPIGERSRIVRTGNGLVRVSTARADELTVGPIERNGIGLHVTDDDSFAVLGMNFLSSLRRWGVEGRWLVLEY